MGGKQKSWLQWRRAQQAKPERLSAIETQWSRVRAAHLETSRDALERGRLVENYGPAVRKYLRAMLPNEDAADEVFQEFVLKLMRGDFRHADSDRGRFRSLIKTALRHLVIDYHRRQGRGGVALPEMGVVDSRGHEDEEQFRLAWRSNLLEEVWGRLEQLQRQTKRPYYSTLRVRADHPEWSVAELRSRLEPLGVTFPTEAALRVFLHRSRKRFAVLLLDQVSASLQDPTAESLEEELIELGLHRYCKTPFE